MVVVVERLRVRASVEEAMSTSPTPLTVLRHIHRSFYSILCGCALSCLTLTLSSHLLISIPVFSYHVSVTNHSFVQLVLFFFFEKENSAKGVLML